MPPSCQQHEQMNHNQNSQNGVSYLETPQNLVPQPKINLGNAVAHNFTNNQGQSFSTRALEGPTYNVTSQSWGPPDTRTDINPEKKVAQDFSVQNFTNNVQPKIQHNYNPTNVPYLETTQSWGPPDTRTEINPENQVAQDFSVQNFSSDVNTSNSSKRSYAEMISTQNPDRSEFGSRGLEVSQGPSHQDPSTINEGSSNEISINEM